MNFVNQPPRQPQPPRRPAGSVKPAAPGPTAPAQIIRAPVAQGHVGARPAAPGGNVLANSARSSTYDVRAKQPAAPVGPPRPPAGANSGPLSAKTLGVKADELFMIMRQLGELLTKENAALKRYRAADVKALAPRKEQLASLYQAHMATLNRDPSTLKGLDTAKRTSLIQMAVRLADLMRDNASMLKANIRSIDIFFHAVTEAVREREEKKSASYSRSGILNGYAMTKRNLAVSYNQTT